MRGGFRFFGFSMPALPSWLGGPKEEDKDPMAAAAVPVDDPVGPAGPESNAPAAEPSEEFPATVGGRRRKRKRKTKKKRGGGCGCASPIVGGRRKKKRRTRKKKKTKRRRRR